MMATIDRAAKRDQDVSAPVSRNEVDALMHRFFDRNQIRSVDGAVPEAASEAAPDTPPRRDFDMATELLDRASRAFDLLITRCQKLERDLDEAHERADAQAAEQVEVIEQWKRLASGLKAQLDVAEGASSAMKQRCDAAEARAALAEQRTTAMERASAQAAGHAAMAESLSTRLHDKVVAAFGIGSRAHPVLEAVATRSTVD